jgi:hypothetical protein
VKNKISHKTLNLIFIALIVVVMITSVLSGNLLAKYATSAEPEVQTARVAKFSIKGEGITEYNIEKDNMYPGMTLEQPISVSNDSEVAVEYVITAYKTTNLPLVFKIDGEIMDPPIIKGTIPVGGDDYQKVLTIEWPIEENDISYSMMVDAIKLSLSVVQVD